METVDILDGFGDKMEVYNLQIVPLECITGFELITAKYKSKYTGAECEADLIQKDGKIWDGKFNLFSLIVEIDEMLKTQNQVVVYDTLARKPELYKINHVTPWLFDTIKRMGEPTAESFDEGAEYFFDSYYAGNDYVRLVRLDTIKTFKI